ncbi:MAG TPA: hypothetical protein VE175_05305, partial [Woeseiaceae bacterium]|nr:hypothetical protein [Woeseiaceae bacterium]
MNISGPGHRRLFSHIVALLVAMTIAPALTGAQENGSRLSRGTENSLLVPLYKSRVLTLDEPAARISVGNAEI